MVDARFIEGGTNIHYLEQKLADMPDLGKNLNGGSPSIAKKSEIKAGA
jgi:acetyl-CoA carboxylase biotin carboxylase subunit